jgi:EmrB/QacA subfamily drug resistance transporter
MTQLDSGRVRFIMQRRWLVTIIVCAGVFMSSLDLFIVNIAFPSIERDFAGPSLSSLSWVVSGYSIVFAALLVPAGRWADAFGRKRAFLLGLAVFVAASAACAAAPSVGLLVAARVVQAAGGAMMLPTSLGLILPEFEPSERHAAIGVWAATGAVAAATGPPLGGVLVQADWRLVFLVNIPVGLAGLVAGSRVLAERREQGALSPDLAGAVAFVAAIGALVLAIVKGQDWGWGSASVIGLVAFSVVLLAAIWRRSLGHRSPLIDPAMMRVRSFSLAVTASIVFFAGFAAMLLNGVLFLTTVWHESVLTTGLMLFPGPFMASVFSIPSARLGARVGYRLPGIVGAVMFAGASAWWILRVHGTPAYASEYLPGMLSAAPASDW